MSWFVPVPLAPITEPLGRYWEAPDMSEVTLTLAFAWMSKSAFDKLHNYQYTSPTGMYAGKMWKRTDRRGHWMLCYTTPHPDPEYTNINYIRIGILP